MLRMLMSAPPPVAPALRVILSGGEPLGTAPPRAVGENLAGRGRLRPLRPHRDGLVRLLPDPFGPAARHRHDRLSTEQVTFRVAAEGRCWTPAAPASFRSARHMACSAISISPSSRRLLQRRLFRTGDLVRVRADGRVEIVCPIKEIISRGGHKIASGGDRERVQQPPRRHRPAVHGRPR